MDHALPRRRTRRRRPDPLEVLCAIAALAFLLVTCIWTMAAVEDVDDGKHLWAAIEFCVAVYSAARARYWFREWWRRNQQR